MELNSKILTSQEALYLISFFNPGLLKLRPLELENKSKEKC